MKGISRFVLAGLLGLVVVLPGTISAQDDEWTCEEGPHDIVAAAQAAYDEANELEGQAKRDKLAEVYWLAAQGEALCATVPDRFGKIQFLRMRTNPRNEYVRVEMGDFALAIGCVGEGSPTVIFENGLTLHAVGSWLDVKPAISTVTRTCSYDRRNVGLSKRAARLGRDAVRTTQDQVNDLVLLLETAEIEPPYVMVGHSIAGFNIALFTDQYPDLVAGIVLVDATHPWYNARAAELDPDVAAMIEAGPFTFEKFDWATSMAQTADFSGFGDIPLVVLAARMDHDDLWFEMQEDFASRSTNSRYIIAENSNHLIMYHEPALIIDAILWVLDEVRATED